MFSLKNKVAIITGGGSGIGLATVKRFLEAGAKVVIADITNQTALAKELGCLFVKTDVSFEEDVKNLMEQTEAAYGKIDILINNAGIIIPEMELEETDIKAFERVQRINTHGVIYALKYGPRHMNDGGSIINTSSTAAKTGFPGYAAYGSSKAVVLHLTRTAAIELSPRGIRVNCICPTTVATPMAYAEGCETELTLSKIVYPVGRMAEPEECAALFHFLASDDCRYITGASIDIDGGFTAGPSLMNLELILTNAPA